MRWLDRLLGRTPPEAAAERDKDRHALAELHSSFDKVQVRTDRLERELKRVNAELRTRYQKQGQPR